MKKIAALAVGLGGLLGACGDGEMSEAKVASECTDEMFGSFALTARAWTQAQLNAAQAARRGAVAVVETHSSGDGYVLATGTLDGVRWRCTLGDHESFQWTEDGDPDAPPLATIDREPAQPSDIILSACLLSLSIEDLRSTAEANGLDAEPLIRMYRDMRAGGSCGA